VITSQVFVDELLVTIRGCGQLLWHKIQYKESKLQQVPNLLREYLDKYLKLKRIIVELIYVFFSKKTLFNN
jgi:hypothetical protein